MSLTDKQLDLRAKTLGASEIAAACGIGRYRRPIDVWASKVGLAPPIDAQTARRFRLGHAMEVAVAGEYEELCGFGQSGRADCNNALIEGRHVWPEYDGTVFHAEHPWCTATPDRVVLEGVNHGAFVSEATRLRLVELKTATGFSAQGWEGFEGADGFWVGDVPLDYEAQCLWQMFVTGIHECDLCVLLNGAEFRAYHIPWDEDAAMALFRRAEHFWTEYVQPRVAPPTDGSESWADVFERLHPKDSGLMMPLDEERAAMARRYLELNDEEAAVKAEKERVKQHFMEVIADELGYESPDLKVTWRKGKTGRTDWESVAKEIGATPDLIAKHTATPTRRFEVRAKEAKVDKNNHGGG